MLAETSVFDRLLTSFTCALAAKLPSAHTPTARIAACTHLVCIMPSQPDNPIIQILSHALKLPLEPFDAEENA
jgi:hypothetical protein